MKNLFKSWHRWLPIALSLVAIIISYMSYTVSRKTFEYEKVEFEMPDSMQRKTICKETGKLASGDSCTKVTEYFVEGTAPKQSCPGHEEETPAETPTENADNTTGDTTTPNN